ncbi:MAG TPA: transporter [Lachnospiraceae bacterium]|nr:transporter [Lachnospiraceae bacterium]
MHKPNLKKELIKPLILLHLIVLLYSGSAVCSKLAAGERFLSSSFILLYGTVLLLLFIYAVLWQQVLKKMPLTTAYANKAVSIIWGLVWGGVFFSETITLKKIIASVMIMIGVGLVVTCRDE